MKTSFSLKGIPLESMVRLSDKYPSGLEWINARGKRKAGSMCGRWVKGRSYYVVRLLGETVSAHRIVYYLRNNEDPVGKDIIHGLDNLQKDNRKELFVVHRNAKRRWCSKENKWIIV